jgi:hypothetical protein
MTRVLIGCEFSGVVRNAFLDLGIEAWSCDIIPSEPESKYHIQGDVMPLLKQQWDLGIFHPPCTYLCNSGVRWLHTREGRWNDMRQGAEFFKQILEANIPRICIENPIMHKHAKDIIGSNHTQIIQPWQFGHGETKATCLWLKNLPKLEPTNIVEGREGRIHKMTPGPNRSKERSKTFVGIAVAMAEQWSKLL